jgi:hypothetical protein
MMLQSNNFQMIKQILAQNPLFPIPEIPFKNPAQKYLSKIDKKIAGRLFSFLFRSLEGLDKDDFRNTLN